MKENEIEKLFEPSKKPKKSIVHQCDESGREKWSEKNGNWCTRWKQILNANEQKKSMNNKQWKWTRKTLGKFHISWAKSSIVEVWCFFFSPSLGDEIKFWSHFNHALCNMDMAINQIAIIPTKTTSVGCRHTKIFLSACAWECVHTAHLYDGSESFFKKGKCIIGSSNMNRIKICVDMNILSIDLQHLSSLKVSLLQCRIQILSTKINECRVKGASFVSNQIHTFTVIKNLLERKIFWRKFVSCTKHQTITDCGYSQSPVIRPARLMYSTNFAAVTEITETHRQKYFKYVPLVGVKLDVWNWTYWKMVKCATHQQTASFLLIILVPFSWQT